MPQEIQGIQRDVIEHLKGLSLLQQQQRNTRLHWFLLLE